MTDARTAPHEYYFPGSNANVGSVIMRDGAWAEQRDFTALNAFYLPELLAVVDLAQKVRDAQKHYSKVRTGETLLASQVLERQLDATLAHMKEPA